MVEIKAVSLWNTIKWSICTKCWIVFVKYISDPMCYTMFYMYRSKFTPAYTSSLGFNCLYILMLWFTVANVLYYTLIQ